MRPLRIVVLVLLALLTAGFLAAAGLLGVFADRLGLVERSGFSASALFTGGVVFLILAIGLGGATPFLTRRRPAAWQLALFLSLIAMLWSFYNIAQVISIFHVEWYTTAALAAVLCGYLPTVRRFFRPLDLE